MTVGIALVMVVPVLLSIPQTIQSTPTSPAPVQSKAFDNQDSHTGPRPEGYTLRAPIDINGNSDFTIGKGVVGGIGTKSNPYIISGWEFDGSMNVSQIRINRTDKYFIIKDCYVRGGIYSNSTIGIITRDVRNGRLENNTITGGYYRGIYMVSEANDSYNNKIICNTIYNNICGIWVHAYDPGISNVYNITVSSNCVYNNTGSGIVIGCTHNNTIINNTIYANSAYGMIVHWGWNSNFTYNRIYENNGGIEMDANCYDNQVHHNDFVNNLKSGGEQANVSFARNFWNTSTEGNYWSDYTTRYPYAVKIGNVWNKSYDIAGGADVKDNYPLADPATPSPSQPILLFPTNGGRFISNIINLSWSTSYGLQLVRYDVFLDNINPPTTKIASNLNTTNFITTTDDGIKYYWYVKAVDIYNDANSTICNFTENAMPPEATVPITPSNDAENVSYGLVNISWTPGPPDPDGDTVTYYWYVDNESSVTYPYIANGTTTGNTSTDFTTLPNTTYYWHVRANDSYEWSNWSETWNFTTGKVDTPPKVLVISPNGGEIWTQSVGIIKWNATDDKQLPPNPIRLYYSLNNGSNWGLLNSSYPNTGSYTWNPLPAVVSTEYLVKVECIDSASQVSNDTSNSTFTIVISQDNPPSVSVISPNGCEVWDQDTIHLIKWNATDDQPLSSTCINISYSADNGTSWTIIGYELNNNGTMAWQVPNIYSWESLVKVECTDSAMQTTIDTSNKTFTIREVTVIPDEPPYMYLLAPKAGDIWYKGELKTIRWNATDDHALPAGCVNITCQAIWHIGAIADAWIFSVVDHANNTGSFNWMVPNLSVEAYISIKITDSKGQNATDTSGKFIIEKWNMSTNTKPIITSTPNTTATLGKKWTYQIIATDAEVQWGDYLTYSVDKPPQRMEINETSGLITWTPDITGDYTITVVVTDSQDKSTNQTFTIKVTGDGEEELNFSWIWIVAIFVVFFIMIMLYVRYRRYGAKKPGEKEGTTSEDRKKKIYDYIAKHSDDDSESISKALDMQKRDLETDVGLMVDLGVVEERRDGKHRRYTVKKPLEEPAEKQVVISKTPSAKEMESKTVMESVKPPPEITKKAETKPADIKISKEDAEIFASEPPTLKSPIAEEKDILRCPICYAKVTVDTVKCPECGEILKKEEKKIEPQKEELKKAPVVLIPTGPAILKLKKDVPPKTFSHAERVVIHLYPSARYRNEVEVPYEYTQTGMEELLEIKQSVLTNVLKDLIEDRKLIVKDLKHVKESPRRLYAYFLTVDGEKEANWLKKKMMDEKEKKE